MNVSFKEAELSDDIKVQLIKAPVRGIMKALKDMKDADLPSAEGESADLDKKHLALRNYVSAHVRYLSKSGASKGGLVNSITNLTLVVRNLPDLGVTKEDMGSATREFFSGITASFGSISNDVTIDEGIDAVTAGMGGSHKLNLVIPH